MKSRRQVSPALSTGDLFLLDICGRSDGFALDVSAGQVYWINAGGRGANEGSIHRADLDGTNHVVIVPAGSAGTPAQLRIDVGERKIHWLDSGRSRRLRANLDGSGIETLPQVRTDDFISPVYVLDIERADVDEDVGASVVY